MIGTTVAHYRILEKLGEGGMGVVYRAEDLTLRRQVALKFLAAHALGRDDQRRRFLHEAQAAAALDHPNICPIHAIEERDDQIFIAMALAEGDNLKRRLASGPLPYREATNIALQVAKGLDAAHAEGIVHRDVKSANIMVTEKGHARVTDFGLAKLPGVELSDPTLVLGTPGYMSPEQVRAAPLDLRTDIWSWGVVCYEMLTGHLPFHGDHPLAVVHAIIHDTPPAPSTIKPDVPRYWDRIVLRALEKSPEDRFGRISDAAAFLERGEAPTSTSGRRRAPPPRDQPSIAVLPFVDMSADADQEYFCDGIAEEIINALSKIQALRVAARTSSFAFKGKSEDIRAIGRKLKVATVLEGSVRKAGNRLRVTAQLINVADGYHLWSERYDRELEDVFAIQDEIAQNIVKALRVELSEHEKRALERAPTENVEAYEYYLRGRQYFHQEPHRHRVRAPDVRARHRAGPEVRDGLRRHRRLLLVPLTCTSTAARRTCGVPREASARALELAGDLAEAHAARGPALSR